jgi:hypothetical protein
MALDKVDKSTYTEDVPQGIGPNRREGKAQMKTLLTLLAIATLSAPAQAERFIVEARLSCTVVQTGGYEAESEKQALELYQDSGKSLTIFDVAITDCDGDPEIVVKPWNAENQE